MCRKLASSEYSHQTSWAHLRANQLMNIQKDCKIFPEGTTFEVQDYDGRRHSKDWSEFDVVYLYHGMDYRPGPYINVFDGLVEHAAKFFERLIWTQHSHVKFVSLDLEMPPYGQLCKIKKGTRSDYWANVDWDAVQSKCASITEWIKDPCKHYAPGKYRHLVIGDSHAHSAYKPTSMILRKDERSLAGVLRKGIANEIKEYGGWDMSEIDSLTCYWGNIDIRHHLCREADPLQATRDLLAQYEKALMDLQRPIELVTMLPIEDESRVLPKSGWYSPKGSKQDPTPFYGSQAQRKQVMTLFNDLLRDMADRHGGKSWWSIYEWPEEWYKMDGVEFMSTYMERPRSVHLARKYYRTDLVNNCINPYLSGEAETVAPQKALLEF